jgi:diacylglycerol O-acyltransferase / wax synthase
VGFDRVSANDLTTLATDRGQVPMNIGAVLTLAGDAEPRDVVAEIAQRLAAVPRFRQRLLVPGLGAGRPVWVDDPGFDPMRHVHRLPGATLDAAADLVCRRLPPDRPLWAMGWSVGQPGELRVVLVIHHVLADGLGGLAVLVALADGMPTPAPTRPVPLPRRSALTADAVRAGWHGLSRSGEVARQARAGLRELGILRQRPSAAARTSLTRPTSGRRRLRVVRAPLAQVVAAGRAQEATVNDVVLTAVSGALFELLAGRGEHPAELVVSVPISMRERTSTDRLGNEVGAVPITVNAQGDPVARLRAIAARTRQAKGEQRGHSALILGWLFRGLGRLHLVQYFLDHQRLVHTFETNLRGPETRIRIAGHEVTGIVPMAVNPGNVGVSFDVLSYAGELAIAIVADPVIVPDLDELAAFVADQLDALTE